MVSEILGISEGALVQIEFFISGVQLIVTPECVELSVLLTINGCAVDYLVCGQGHFMQLNEGTPTVE